MSRGPGALQRRILEVLAQEPAGYLPWRRLQDRFPLQVRDKSFYRAIRSLRTMKRIDDYIVDHGPGPGLCGRARYIGIITVYEVGGRLRFALEADRERAALADEARRQLKSLETLAAARGIRLEPGSKPPLGVLRWTLTGGIVSKRLTDYRDTRAGSRALNDAREHQA